MYPTESPFKVYTGLDGKPLDNGYVYFGIANQNPITSPVTVYWDAAGTQPAAQPLRTENGYIMRAGTPANVFYDGAYSELVQDSRKRQVFYSRTSVDFSIATALLAFIALLVSSVGASLVGFIQNIAGAVYRTLQDKMGDIVTVNDFVTGGDGTEGDPWTGWDTEITWSPSTRYGFIDGHYAYATSPNFAHDHLCLQGTRGTVIHHTGAGYAMIVDAGAGAGLLNTKIQIKNIRLESNAAATGGVLWRGIIHSETDMVFRNIPGVCFTEYAGILNTHRLEHTALVVGETIAPTSLLAISIRAVGEESSANTYYLIAENCTAQGVVLNECVNSVFIGLTSETNGNGGYFISSSSHYNTFLNIDLEGNTGSDISCSGNYNNFIGVLSTGTCTFNGANNLISGGIYNTILSGGTRNTFQHVSYSANAGAFTETGTATVRRSVFNITTAALLSDIYPTITDPVFTGTATFGTGVMNIGAGQVYKDATGIVLIGSTTAIGPGKLQVTNPANTATDQNWRSILGANADTTTAYHLICSTGAGVDKLYIFGNGNVQNANNSYGAISDIKLKENVVDTSSKLADLMRVRVVNYGLKTEPGSKYLGVIAQELEQIFPGMIEETSDLIPVQKTREITPEVPAVVGKSGEMVSAAIPAVLEEYTDTEPNGDVTKGVKYSVFVPILIKALQELKSDFDAYVKTHP